MTAPIRIAVVGVGKIARDQHLPALAANPAFEVVATVTRKPDDTGGFANFRDIAGLVAGLPDVQAVTLCTPPVGRHAIARAALEAGLHVMLEKPPGASVGEIGDLVTLARDKSLALFASWHSREAPGVAPARAWLADKPIRSVAIRWKEDVRRWHPGQDWVWEPGGLGVFDPGINALSIVTRIMPRPLFLSSAELSFPAGRQTPIAATLALTDVAGVPVQAEFDWRQTGEQTWEIVVETGAGTLRLEQGGAVIDIAGERTEAAPAEYPGLYRRFAAVVAACEVDVDLAPFVIAADAFMLGRRREVEAFDW